MDIGQRFTFLLYVKVIPFFKSLNKLSGNGSYTHQQTYKVDKVSVSLEVREAGLGMLKLFFVH